MLKIQICWKITKGATLKSYRVLHCRTGCSMSSILSTHISYLRSAESGCLAITGARTTLGSRNFAVAGAKIWSSLPEDLRLLSQSVRTFGHKLKHYLFVNEPWAHLRFFKVCAIQIFSLLLLLLLLLLYWKTCRPLINCIVIVHTAPCRRCSKHRVSSSISSLHPNNI